MVATIPAGCEGSANFMFQILNSLTRVLRHFTELFFKFGYLTEATERPLLKSGSIFYWLQITISFESKSYNSQVGVPLSVVAINEKHNLGIFEGRYFNSWRNKI
jgi:alanine racemase